MSGKRMRFRNMIWPCAVGIFSLSVVFYCQGAGIGDRYTIQNDARQYLFPFYAWSDHGLFRGDFFASYASALTPPGIKAVYRLLSGWMDIISISKLLPFMLCPLTAIFLFLAGRKIWSPMAGAFAAVSFVLYAWHIHSFSGGFPRAFGFPLCVLFVYFCAHGRWLAAGAICLVQVFFYPPLALVCGSALVMYLLAGGANRVNWVRATLILLVMMMGLVSVVLVSRGHGGSYFGKMYALPEMLIMPEFFDGGRAPLFVGDIQRVWGEEVIQERIFGVNICSPVWFFMLGFSLIGWRLIYRREIKAPSFIGMGLLAAIAWYILSWGLMLDLFLPGRILKFILPVLMILMASASLTWVTQRLASRGTIWIQLAIMAFLCACSWPSLYPDVHDHSKNKAFYEFLATLPAEAVIAGHPSDMDGIPLFSKRRVYVMEELSLPFYRTYYTEIQRRTRVMFSIYYATDIVKLREDCDRERIRYIVIRPAYFKGPYLRQGMFYLEPYNSFIRKLVEKGVREGFVLDHVSDKAVVYSSSDMSVIDVDQL